MPKSSELPRIARRRSSVHGYGVFARVTIASNRRIIDYAGELIRNDADCEAREERHRADGCIWVFRLNRAWSRDAAVGGNIARFINHSCTPNCRFEVVDKTIWDQSSPLHPSRRGAHVRLLHHRKPQHPVPLPAGLSHQNLTDWAAAWRPSSEDIARSPHMVT